MAFGYGGVVVGVDGSPQSLGALRWAADEAVRHTRQLRVVHACRAGNAHAGIAVDAAAEARRWLPGVDAVASTDAGDPVAVLRRYAAGSPLVVIAGEGRAGRVPLGSVADALGRQADCPVLLVHDALRWAAADAVLPRDAPIVVGFDGTPSAHRALRLAFEEASSRLVRLVTVQAWRHPDLWQPGNGHGADLSTDADRVRDRLLRAVEPWRDRYPQIEVDLRPQTGKAAEVLSSVSQWALLLVLGVPAPFTVADPGSQVVADALRGAACPVLLAHEVPKGSVRSGRVPTRSGLPARVHTPAGDDIEHVNDICSGGHDDHPLHRRHARKG